jgi:hypothetical protein
MNQRLLDAYLEYSGEQARAGIIDDSLTENLDDERPLEDRIEDILRAAGRLPEGWSRGVEYPPISDAVGPMLELTPAGRTSLHQSTFSRRLAPQPRRWRSQAGTRHIVHLRHAGAVRVLA